MANGKGVIDYGKKNEEEESFRTRPADRQGKCAEGDKEMEQDFHRSAES